ncbi:MAG: electron transfer flavoprotein subunit beta/FixA family protein [candidate division WOR-3 bacterium]
MQGLKIIVCAKQVPDPEAPTSELEVDNIQMKVITRGLPPVINPLDEAALEAALQLTEIHGGKITVLSVGDELSAPVLRKTLAAGANELVLVQDECFKDLNEYSIAFVLSKAIQKIGEYDLILTGREGADWHSGQVGLILAELLGIPAVSLAKRIEVSDGEVTITRIASNGLEVVKTALPALITVTSEFGELRYVSLGALKSARTKPIIFWSAKDINVDPTILKKRKIISLFKPMRDRKCTIIRGETPEEISKNLVNELLKVLKTFYPGRYGE